MLDTNITIELVTKEQIQLLNTIMSSSYKWEMNMSVCRCKERAAKKTTVTVCVTVVCVLFWSNKRRLRSRKCETVNGS